ncbi:MAG: 30S ribosomal protein S12 methylthiotransferase RimO [Polyangiaceae bacterium]|nr:30S ribosomal protein S12 methylthiotransferase RimO [Polyangiaceae bacterium]
MASTTAPKKKAGTKAASSGFGKVHFVSLGCPKNRVDSEVMLGVAEASGYRQVNDAEDAEVIVVNTCGFIDAAKQESIETILELAKLKTSGNCKRLVVTGCLSQRYPNELAEGMPEVDHFLGSSDMLRMKDVFGGTAPRMFVGRPQDWVVSADDPRTLSTRGASAYLKLAEGCNRSCSFCVIPQLRGKQRSRTAIDIVSEAKRLVDLGVRELNLVSQDTVAYGRDLKDGGTLANTVRELADIDGVHWVRVFYLYPEKLDDAFVDLLANHPKVVPYVDMPIQHAADNMLRRMKRGHGGQRLRDLVTRLRTHVPELTFRTAFIVGHPGETETEFRELVDFVKWARFDRVGVFEYSDESSAASSELAGKVDPKLAHERALELTEVQRTISREINDALIGKTLEILVEGPSEESELVMVGRHRGQAPDIDGQVFLSGPALPGEIRRAEVVEAQDYDLHAEVLDEEPLLPVAAVRHKRAPTNPSRRPLRTLA